MSPLREIKMEGRGTAHFSKAAELRVDRWPREQLAESKLKARRAGMRVEEEETAYVRDGFGSRATGDTRNLRGSGSD